MLVDLEQSNSGTPIAYLHAQHGHFWVRIPSHLLELIILFVLSGRWKMTEALFQVMFHVFPNGFHIWNPTCCNFENPNITRSCFYDRSLRRHALGQLSEVTRQRAVFYPHLCIISAAGSTSVKRLGTVWRGRSILHSIDGEVSEGFPWRVFHSNIWRQATSVEAPTRIRFQFPQNRKSMEAAPAVSRE